MSLDPERMPAVYPVFAWLEIAERLTALGDGALGEAIRQAMNGPRLGDDAAFDLNLQRRTAPWPPRRHAPAPLAT